jgi:hypothetical protein
LLSQMASQEESSPLLSVKRKSSWTPAALTKKLNSCCPSLYPFKKIPILSAIPELSRWLSSFNILDGSSSYIVAPK